MRKKKRELGDIIADKYHRYTKQLTAVLNPETGDAPLPEYWSMEEMLELQEAFIKYLDRVTKETNDMKRGVIEQRQKLR